MPSPVRPPELRTPKHRPSAPTPERPLRRDAQRTRAKILVAAADLFAKRGLDVSYDEIARAAGVGVGTVYRRFPDRDGLIDALFADKVAHMLAIVQSAIEIDDPWQAIDSFFHTFVASLVRDRGLVEVLANSGLGEEHVDELRRAMGDEVSQLLSRARDAGVVRDDLELIDLVLMAHLISRFSVRSGEEVWRRYATLFLQAIRPGAGQDLPGPIPTIDMFEEIALNL